MRKPLIIAILPILLAAAGCIGQKKAVEKLIPAANVEILGDGAPLMSIAGDVKVFMSPNREQWNIKALVPLKNTKESSNISVSSCSLEILDANLSKIDNIYKMEIQNTASATALLASPEGTVKNIAFEPEYSSLASGSYESVSKYVERTEHLVLELSVDSDVYSSVIQQDDGKVYSRGFDGFVNMRESPSFSAKVIGRLMNGPDGAGILEEGDDWIKVDNAGLIGYVPASYIQRTPTEEYTGSVTADWVVGAWVDGSDFVYLYNNGTFVKGEDSVQSYGLFVMQNNEVKLSPVWSASGSDDDSILEIDTNFNTLGGYHKTSSPDAYKELRVNFNKVIEQERTNSQQSLLSGIDSAGGSIGSSSSDTDIDEWLDSYEKYTDRFISIAKKASNGDMSAFSEYGRLNENLVDLAEKIEDVTGSMTVAQMNRFNRIQQKYTQALGSML